ncbi:hypothetical protein [Flavobacterium sp.]|uniref:hypothetical protein n=1 Tax=Flavobacterium sp. TaxID=239 RepID=UPI0026385FC7|nr:hypothetical protein [Flavobacterium sp.]
MNLNKFSKETLTIVFYVVYIAISYLFYLLFPGDAKTPNFGKLMMFLLVPIAFAYACVQIYKHFNSDKSYFKCLLIHTVAWFSIVTFLTNLKQ